ncbi:MAG TPA: hypothetical protein PLG99_04525, partial [Kaistiaceae bacterium]|nr:hypothetical protein [Kaistiaceae bacterium]
MDSHDCPNLHVSSVAIGGACTGRSQLPNLWLHGEQAVTDLRRGWGEARLAAALFSNYVHAPFDPPIATKARRGRISSQSWPMRQFTRTTTMFKGSITALITPFANGAVDEKALAGLV